MSKSLSADVLSTWMLFNVRSGLVRISPALNARIQIILMYAESVQDNDSLSNVSSCRSCVELLKESNSSPNNGAS